jgi:hypothetical protein
MDSEKPSFWHTLPGMLTGIAAVISAITALLIAVVGNAPINSPEILAEKWILIGDDAFIGKEPNWATGPIMDPKKTVGSARQVSGIYRLDFETDESLSQTIEAPYGASFNFRLGIDIKIVESNSNHIGGGA